MTSTTLQTTHTRTESISVLYPKFSIKKKNGAYTITIPVKGRSEDIETLLHTAAAFGFLIPWNSTITAPEFRELIYAYCQNDRVKALCCVLDRY